MLYNFIIYTENFAGMLNQVTNVFMRRQINIETINAGPCKIPGVHKYALTCHCEPDEVDLLARLIEKKVDVLLVQYFTDDEVFITETSLFQLSSPMVMTNSDIPRIIRHFGGHIIDTNLTYTIVENTGSPENILAMHDQLRDTGCILHYARSGRTVIAKSEEEPFPAFSTSNFA